MSVTKISELAGPIAVADADLLPAVQSGTTRKITWGALKATLAGALGRAYLGLGTAAVANITTDPTDSTAGRVLTVGAFGLGTLGSGPLINLDSTSTPVGLYRWTAGTGTPPAGNVGNATVLFERINAQVSKQTFTNVAGGAGTPVREWIRTSTATDTWGLWVGIFTSTGANVLTVDTGTLGYSTGSGGAVTQAASKATGVTLNKPTGQITTHAASLAANTAVAFTLTNSKIAADDVPTAVIKSGATAGAYVLGIDAVAAGSCRVSIRNMTAGALAETLVLQFNTGKGATA